MYADTFWVGRGVSATLKHICIHMLTNNSSLSKFDFTLFYIPRKKTITKIKEQENKISFNRLFRLKRMNLQ